MRDQRKLEEKEREQAQAKGKADRNQRAAAAKARKAAEDETKVRNCVEEWVSREWLGGRVGEREGESGCLSSCVRDLVGE